MADIYDRIDAVIAALEEKARKLGVDVEWLSTLREFKERTETQLASVQDSTRQAVEQMEQTISAKLNEIDDLITSMKNTSHALNAVFEKQTEVLRDQLLAEMHAQTTDMKTLNENYLDTRGEQIEKMRHVVVSNREDLHAHLKAERTEAMQQIHDQVDSVNNKVESTRSTMIQSDHKLKKDIQVNRVISIFSLGCVIAVAVKLFMSSS